MSVMNYIRPGSLEEAVDYLDANGQHASIIAGGTDVLVDLRAGELRVRDLVDVSRIEELKGIRMTEAGLSVGAGVTIAELLSSEILAEYAPTLKRCAATFAAEQVRNVATIGGNVAHCSPCGDTIPPLVIHEAKAVLVGKGGRREIPVTEIATGAYKCSLPRTELIEKFILKPEPDLTFADFQKIGRRKALAISRITMAGMARQSADGTIDYIRLSLGSCTPTPWRVTAVEDLLTGKKATSKLLWEAGALLAAKTIEITGRRSSAIYKEPAVQGLCYRLLYPMVGK